MAVATSWRQCRTPAAAFHNRSHPATEGGIEHPLAVALDALGVGARGQRLDDVAVAVVALERLEEEPSPVAGSGRGEARRNDRARCAFFVA